MINKNDFNEAFIKFEKINLKYHCYDEKNKLCYKKVCKEIYFLHYITNRLELKDKFKSGRDFEYWRSCFFESFIMQTKNYNRASLLILRSGLEIYLKSFLDVIGVKGVNDRIFSCNLALLKGRASNENIFWRTELTSVVGRFNNTYSKLSGAIHSNNKLINTISKFNQIEKYDNAFTFITLEYISKTLHDINILNILMNRDSINNWEHFDKTNLIGFLFSKNKAKNIIGNLNSAP